MGNQSVKMFVKKKYAVLMQSVWLENMKVSALAMLVTRVILMI